MPPPCRAATINSRQARQSHHADASVAAAVAAIFTVATAAANAAAAVNAVTTKFFFAKFRQDRCLAGLTYGGALAMSAISRAQRLLLLLLDLESNLLSSSLAQWKKIWL